jgi:hypothetical protein
MIDFQNETVSLGWCDNGSTDGKFTEGIAYTFLGLLDQGMMINQIIRVQGNQIARQRETLIRQWEEKNDTDWLLWVDSDIFLNVDLFKILASYADKETHKVISGVYFIAKENLETLPTPMACIFSGTDEENNKVIHVHPLPENKLIEIDAAGMGLVLMHRSALEAMRKVYGPDQALFEEKTDIEDKFVSEDIMFFRKLKVAGIQSYAHTGATATHIKRFPLDINYYNMYWDNVNKMKR